MPLYTKYLFQLYNFMVMMKFWILKRVFPVNITSFAMNNHYNNHRLNIFTFKGEISITIIFGKLLQMLWQSIECGGRTSIKIIQNQQPASKTFMERWWAGRCRWCWPAATTATFSWRWKYIFFVLFFITNSLSVWN